MERERTCCFTGHRQLPWGDREEDPRCVRLRQDIRSALERAYAQGYRRFICGMARGCDLLFCEEVQALRDREEGVAVEAAVPCEGQTEHWPAAERERYERLLGLCDFETVVQRTYDRDCMLRRDRYMVDRSSLVIAAYDGVSQRGGTFYTAAYALKQGVRIELIDL